MSGGATHSSYSSVQATNALQGTSINGGNNSFSFISQVPLGSDPDGGAQNVHWKVPRRPNTLFTGRTDVLRRIKNAIQDGPQQDGVFVITGLGGLGKSEVCLKIANEMRSEFWAVFWVDVSSPDIAKSEFINVASMLGQKVDSIEGACILLANTRKRCLLILDNADDPRFDYSAYLPSSMHGIAIITSRYDDCKRFNNIDWEALADLSTADCIELLLKAAEVPKERWGAETKAAEDVVRVVQSHTLALIQAGAYVARRHSKLADYPAEFERQRARLLEFSSTQARSRYGNVYATFEASADVLSEDALGLLGVVSALSYSFLPLSLFESAWRGSQQARGRIADFGPGLGDLSSWDVSQPYSVIDMTGNETGLDVLNQWHVAQVPAFVCPQDTEWDADRLHEAIYELRSLSLITCTEEDSASGISLHPLVYAWTRDRQRTEARKASWLAAGCVFALAALGSPERTEVKHALQPHIQSWADEKIRRNVSCGTQTNMVALVWSCSWMLVQMRDDSRLDNLLRALFEGAGCDPDQPQDFLAPLYHLYAQSHCLNGNARLAVPLAKRVVEMRQRHLDEWHANRLAGEHLLAVAYLFNGQIQEAVDMLEHVVKIRSTTLAETHPSRLASQHELARAYLSKGKTQEAVDMLEHVVKIQSTTLAETHPSRLASQHALAGAYLSKGKTQEAVDMLEHVVKIRSTTLAETHPDRLASQNELAGAYLSKGKTQEAVDMLEHVVNIWSTTLAETHPSRLASQHELARAYLSKGKTQEAVDMLEHVVKIRSTTLAETHPDRLVSQNELAGAYLSKGKTQEAVDMLEHVVNIWSTTLAETHPSRLASQHELARAYLSKGKTQEAVDMLEHVVKIQSTTLAETHPSRLASQHALAGAYLSKGKTQEAVDMLEHVVKMKSTTLAETHPDRLASQHELARAYLSKGKTQEAVDMLEHVVKIQSTTLAETHPDRLVSQKVLAYARNRLKKR